ncbi:ATP-grasp fold amidoligase family protein [Clostridium sp.]|uniref:ATP-grasp fold amidoligase family protein n=1 Tax=Clostridium sp. TaxID=1506 RepID=UPI003D6D9ABE
MNKTFKNLLLIPMNILYIMSPKTELKLMFYLKHGYKLNLDNPKTYNEKLNWIKLYYHNELMPVCADKYAVRQYVNDCGCGDILNDLLWEGFDASEIPFDDLPKQFVIKVTHGSGNNIICKNKDELNKEKTRKQLNKWLKNKYLPCYGEWFYGVVKPRIIIETFLCENNLNIPEDYKMFYFNNKEGAEGVGVTAIYSDKFINQNSTLYDAEWNILSDVFFDNLPNNNLFEKPELYEKMIDYAKILSFPFPHVRVDFYVIREKIYFGELTFINGAGFDKITPHSFDEIMGNWIKLPNKQVRNIEI